MQRFKVVYLQSDNLLNIVLISVISWTEIKYSNCELRKSDFLWNMYDLLIETKLFYFFINLLLFFFIYIFRYETCMLLYTCSNVFFSSTFVRFCYIFIITRKLTNNNIELLYSLPMIQAKKHTMTIHGSHWKERQYIRKIFVCIVPF